MEKEIIIRIIDLAEQWANGDIGMGGGGGNIDDKLQKFEKIYRKIYDTVVSAS